MFAKRQSELSERRRLLIMEADLHRSLIGVERENLRERFAESARAGAIAGGPMLIAGGTVAGLIAVRHWRKLVRCIPAALTLFRWIQSLKRGGRGFAARNRQDAAPIQLKPTKRKGTT